MSAPVWLTRKQAEILHDAQNGRAILPAVDDAVEAMVAVAKGDWDVDRFAAWLGPQPRAR